MTIGEKIRQMRKSKGITQEQLASSIGISFQSVSKWENNLAMPDITMALALAKYFNVSMDELFSYSLSETEKAVSEIVGEAYIFRESDPETSRRILEAGLSEYPDNEVLLNNLLYVLNYSENPDETISVAEKLIERTDKSDIKYDALRFLAYACKVKGDMKSAEAAIEQIPEIYFTKLTEKAFLLSGEAKLEAAEKQKWISLENLLQMMWKISEYFDETGEADKAIAETEKALELIRIFDNSSYDVYTEFFGKQIKRMKDNK